MKTVNDRGHVMGMIDALEQAGGRPTARIYRDTLGARRTTIVSLRFGSYRAKVGELPTDLVGRLWWRIRWNSLTNRAISVPARIDTDPGSPTYLSIWLGNNLPTGADQPSTNAPVSAKHSVDGNG
ncbi:hypothetical protein [Subtercola frigoramans]|uniref:Uncharacterized protein n=1 Tax=Subtercola frigoramans TaxID=120298 RepID=A0ABS2L0L3_9MICO|nr:hypothetical protein [Subtercola frigoramans]MBM7470620.1 hypothetical protein [Subtercola frigoramans]